MTSNEESSSSGGRNCSAPVKSGSSFGQQRTRTSFSDVDGVGLLVTTNPNETALNQPVIKAFNNNEVNMQQQFEQY